MLLLATKCGTDPVDEVDFDREAMLRNYAQNLILPAFQDVKNETEKIDNEIVKIK